MEENPGRGRHGVGGGVESSPDDLNRHEEGGGAESSQDNSTPNGGGGGVESWQDDSTPNINRGGVESSWDESTPREVRGPEGVETLGAPTASRSWQGEDGHGRGGGDENPPTAQQNREHPTNGGDGAAPRGAAAMGEAEAEARTEKGAGGVGRPTAHPTGTDLATAAGGPVSGARAGRGGEPNDAGCSPANFTAAAQAATVGGPVSARPAPLIGASQRTEGGGRNPLERSRRGDHGRRGDGGEGPP